VVNHLGKIAHGVDPNTNLLPWCIRRPSSPVDLANAEEFRRQQFTADDPPQPLPYCPDAVIKDMPKPGDNVWVETWTRRGALNAGFSVFLFLDALAHGRVDRTAYNECEKLKP
jgi:hypothetical protein